MNIIENEHQLHVTMERRSEFQSALSHQEREILRLENALILGKLTRDAVKSTIVDLTEQIRIYESNKQ